MWEITPHPLWTSFLDTIRGGLVHSPDGPKPQPGSASLGLRMSHDEITSVVRTGESMTPSGGGCAPQEARTPISPVKPDGTLVQDSQGIAKAKEISQQAAPECPKSMPEAPGFRPVRWLGAGTYGQVWLA